MVSRAWASSIAAISAAWVSRSAVSSAPYASCTRCEVSSARCSVASTASATIWSRVSRASAASDSAGLRRRRRGGRRRRPLARRPQLQELGLKLLARGGERRRERGAHLGHLADPCLTLRGQGDLQAVAPALCRENPRLCRLERAPDGGELFRVVVFGRAQGDRLGLAAESSRATTASTAASASASRARASASRATISAW